MHGVDVDLAERLAAEGAVGAVADGEGVERPEDAGGVDFRLRVAAGRAAGRAGTSNGTHGAMWP